MIADSCVADGISVSEKYFWRYLEYVSRILQNYKNLKRTKVNKFKVSSVLSGQLILVTAVEYFVEKQKCVSLMSHSYISLCIELLKGI